MNDEIDYTNNPLHGIGLKVVLGELVDHYGFEILYAYLNINCFNTNPSIESSMKFLKKTQWAREKLEVFYLYEFKNLPKATYDQFELPPRERIIPDGQVSGEPKELSFEDAERLREMRAEKFAERNDRGAGRAGRDYDAPPNPYSKGQKTERSEEAWGEPSRSRTSSSEGKVDPWAKARKKSE